MKTTRAIFAALLLSGCVNAETNYYSPTQANQTAHCSAIAFGVISSLIVESKYQNCKKRAQKLGYVETSSK